ncbi:class I SAM-dependent methyltransferase [Methanosarcina sp. KYL-1]|uniref:SAM-dependent methyltransferase n=1 Tax=Methanosarcina sp. KYL-1 TaxID=2602068 RepID=UPI0021015199|nr:class I SAM-dependent methyltransferase [Methanosarcina sp. KYL-1]MCQ1536801.1 class I SAM-dependent methyltransferase [Methanosarcina sp. KYL-1]
MEKPENTENKILETGEKKKGSSVTAENVAFVRALESLKPEGERICYDPYAVRFLSQQYLMFMKMAARDPSRTPFPGVHNSLSARVRYFDDFVNRAIDNGVCQLVILGAGYDTRAYRIEGLRGKVRVFEIDHPGTQSVKMEKIKDIFGSLPDHVEYVSVDFEAGNFGQQLIEHGYEKSQKTVFIMEGLIYYLPLKTVDGILSFIAKNSGIGSAIIFDYVHESSIDRTDGICGVQCTACDQNEIKNATKDMAKQGEPYKFGIKEGMLESFLAQRGFSHACNVTSEDYKKAYFHGINESRPVCCLSYFAHAVVK